LWAKKKGVTILATGDITHPLWVKELEGKLIDLKNGLFEFNGVRFILSGEVNLVYNQNGKVRKIHLLITVPSFQILHEVNRAVSSFGNLSIDGRPTLPVDSTTFVKLITKISPSINIIPAHIWTPWFGLFGSKSGFNSIEECFKEETYKIFALETGLSSDPLMNYFVRDIDDFTLVSNSDAHSPENIAREANVIRAVSSYDDLFNVIKKAEKDRFLFTIEFFPEDGKYFGD
jgi:PHP family Zn ribbon phosphoesterase